VFQLKLPKISLRACYDEPLQTRVGKLRAGDKKIIYYYRRPDQGTFRYRVYNMIQALTTKYPSIGATFFFEAEHDVCLEELNNAGALVLVRVQYNEKVAQLLYKAKQAGVKIFYDLDDAIFDLDYTHLQIDTIDEAPDREETWIHNFAVTARTQVTMKQCDHLLCTNPYFAKQLSDFFKQPVSVIPNFLNHEQFELSKKIFNLKKATEFKRSSKITLGYFSGSSSHNKDFEIIAPILDELLKKHKNIKLMMVGACQLEKYFTGVNLNIKKIRLQHYLNLQKYIGSVDVNLVPLQENRFTHCKSDLKYFEAAIVGTITLASPAFPYQQAITHGLNGFLAQTHEWMNDLETLVDPQFSYQTMAARAFEDAVSRYLPEVHAETIYNILLSPAKTGTIV